LLNWSFKEEKKAALPFFEGIFTLSLPGDRWLTYASCGRSTMRFLFPKKRLRELENTKIPVIMSAYYEAGGVEYEDIDAGPQRSVRTSGGFGFAFG
jgi:hypothetical protein